MPEDLDDLELLFAPRLQVAVLEIELLPEFRAEHFGGIRRLALARGGRAAGSHLAAGEIDDADAKPVLHELRGRAAGGELHIVRMRAEEENVDRICHSSTILK